MKVSERLQKRLLEELGLEVRLPERIPRGYHGRCGGQWAWSARYKNGAGEIGSEDTMTQCVQAEKLSTHRHERMASLVVTAEGGAE